MGGTEAVQAAGGVPPRPEDEPQRVEAVAVLGALNATHDEAFDNLDADDLLPERKSAEMDTNLSDQLLRQVSEQLAAKTHELQVAHDRADAAMMLAEEASRARTAFLANMSHELRTPMTAILGFADLLLEEGDDVERRVEHVQTIRRHGERLMATLSDILDLTGIETGRLAIERLECDPAEVLKDVFSLMRVPAQEKGLELALKFVGPVPATIETDPARLKQVLLNLTRNAVKFTDAGQVELSCQLAKPERDGTRMFRIIVGDTGIGVAPEAQERLFQRFEQADARTTRRFGGSGLGLVISQRLAEMLGGFIRCSSLPGVGSTFCVAIHPGVIDLSNVREVSDVTSGDIRGATANAQPIVGNLAGHILLAEDGIDNQRLIGHFLRHVGLDVVFAETGVSALEAVAAAERAGSPFDLVLMDMQMPEMDGYEATRRLRATGFARPIIALTANAMVGDRQRCLAAGCDEYAAKPIDRELLIRLIAEFLAKPAAVRISEPSIASALAGFPDMDDLVAEFVAELPGHTACLVAELDSIEKGGSTEALKRVLHQLKGAGGGYGFDLITGTAADAERCVIAGERLPVIRRATEHVILTLRRIANYDAAAENRCPAA